MKKFPAHNVIQMPNLRLTLDIFAATLAIIGKDEFQISELLRHRLMHKETPKGLNVSCIDRQTKNLLTWYQRYNDRAWVLTEMRGNYYFRICSLYCNTYLYETKNFIYNTPVEYFRGWKRVSIIVMELCKKEDVLPSCPGSIS